MQRVRLASRDCVAAKPQLIRLTRTALTQFDAAILKVQVMARSQTSTVNSGFMPWVNGNSAFPVMITLSLPAQCQPRPTAAELGRLCRAE